MTESEEARLKLDTLRMDRYIYQTFLTDLDLHERNWRIGKKPLVDTGDNLDARFANRCKGLISQFHLSPQEFQFEGNHVPFQVSNGLKVCLRSWMHDCDEQIATLEVLAGPHHTNRSQQPAKRVISKEDTNSFILKSGEEFERLYNSLKVNVKESQYTPPDEALRIFDEDERLSGFIEREDLEDPKVIVWNDPKRPRRVIGMLIVKAMERKGIPDHGYQEAFRRYRELKRQQNGTKEMD